jgi:glycyl-tRNA synthetase beta subunit
VDVTILQEEMKEVKEVHGKRQERQTGKCLILKDHPVVSTEAMAKALTDLEKATKAKKKVAARNRRKRVVSSEEEETSSASDSPDSSDDSEVEMLECIEVSM